MTPACGHLVIAPVVLPLAVGALLLLFDEGRRALKGTVSAVAMLAVVGVAIALMRLADAAAPLVYRVGSWPAPFGIVLVADRLAAVMVLLASVLAFVTLIYSLARWHRAGPRFHSLMLFLLAGVNGSLLTGDLFNLFVFFEVFLVASYGLALHGSGAARVRAGLHYVTYNLAASLLFLIGAALLYGITGTLNMADLAVRVPRLAGSDRALAEAGAAILGTAFLGKAAIWPLGFWLPESYARAGAPVAALFSMLSKIGVYVVLRVWLLLFGAGPGAPSAFGADVLVAAGLMTLAFGIVGMLAAQTIARLAGASLIVSSGTLIAAIGMGRPAVSGPALYYLVASTLGVAALFLLTELVERAREPGADVIAVTVEAFGGFETDEAEEEIGVAIPATMALLGLGFACCALLLAGLPPLPGFIAKFALLAALIAPGPVPASAWILFTLIVLSGFATVIAMGRAGVRIFWGGTRRVPRVRVIELAPVALLLALGMALTVGAGPALRYADAAVQAVHAPRAYVEGVLSKR